MVYSKYISTDIDSVKANISQKASEQGFGILKEYNFKALLKEKGFPIDRDITVYELCNPAAAQEALTNHPELSVYLPCRLSLYQDDKGVVLSTIGIEDILENFELETSLKTKLYAIFERIKALVDSYA